MKRTRLEKPKPRRPVRRPRIEPAPQRRSRAARHLLEELDSLLLEIDRALDPGA